MAAFCCSLESRAKLDVNVSAMRNLDSALWRLITSMVRSQTELYKAYTEDREFREWLNGEMFRATYH